VRWLAAWVVASVLAFLVVASREDGMTGTISAPGAGEAPSTFAVVLAVQVVAAVVVTIAVLIRRSRQHSSA
jgi:hypothetical protein